MNMMSTPYKKRKFILAVCFFLETWCVTYALKNPTLLNIASILYIICGILICCLTVSFPELDQPAPSFTSRKFLMYKWFSIIATAFFIFYFTRYWIRDTPLTFYAADMIPIMKVQAERFLDGQWSSVYDPIPEIWGGIQPIYLPSMWIPFCSALLMHIDLRWLPAFGLFVSIALWIWQWKNNLENWMLLVIVAAVGLVWWIVHEPSHNFIRLSEEGIVVFYYSLLALSLRFVNLKMVGISIALCLLSRYTLVGWLPALVIILLFMRHNPKGLLQIISAALIVILFLLIMPFGIKPLLIAWHLPGQYIEHAIRVWKDNPEYFQNSIGLAKFFGPNRILVLHDTLIVASFTFPTIFVLICYFYEKRTGKKLSHISLSSLKISVVTTLCLIDVPYPYLFFTSSFVSLFIISVHFGKPTVSSLARL